VVVTATRGEHGTDRPDRWGPERLARRRTAETASALAVLGVADHRFLGHTDGACSEVPVEVGRRQVASLLDEIAPDTVITFGPDGMTGHPDHRAMSAWVDRAVRAVRSQPRVLHATTLAGFVEANADLHERMNFFYAGPPPVARRDDIVLTVSADAREAAVKLRAIKAHASQMDRWISEFGEARMAAWWSTEWFEDGRRVGAPTAA
jgi:LmbE family N-acetylglucosaminyl deacetylase